MSVTTAQYVDLLFKKLQGVAKTANATVKGASNESIASPALLRGDIVWTQSSSIPSTAQVVSGVTQGYLTTSRIECTADTTVPTIGGIYPTWLTNLQYWIPQEFGSTWPVKVWVDNAGATDPTATGTQIFATGIGGVGEFFFDTQAGVLNFIGETIPATLTTGKSIFITGYRYVGLLGVTNLPSATIGNIQITGNSIVSLNSNGDIVIAPNGSGNVRIVANASVSGSFTTTGNVTGGNILTAGIMSSTGNAIYGNILTAGQVSATANITGGNIITGGLISATSTITSAANVIGGNLTTAGQVSATANIVGGNITTAGQVTATSNITGGNLLTGGLISATSTITSAANVVGGNITTAGQVTATANITGGNITTAGQVTATANITGGNILTGGLISATGNITGGNVNTSTVRSTGAITVATGSGNLNLSPTTGNIVVNSTYINGVNDPVQNQDVATKAYVDNMAAAGINYHQPVLAATTTTLATTTGGTITYTQPNGVSNGIGAYISTTGAFNLIDTANVQTANTRILIKNEANAVLNGVYYWANASTIIRTTDTDSYGPDSTTDLSLNDYFFVQSGNVNAGSAYVVSAPPGTITFGTSNITFSQFSSSQTYTANNSAGISLVGTVINAKIDNNTTAFDGNGNIIVKASANLTTPNIGAATGTSLSVTANVTGGNVLTGGLISATGAITSVANVTGGNLVTGGIATVTGNITGGNVLTGGLISATANITGGNLTTAGQVNATANITGGNVLTGGLISATSTITSAANITGGNLATAGQVTATANITGGNLLTAGLASVAGNITGGNIATGGIISATGNITGNYMLGNGYFLTGIITSVANINNGTSNVNIASANANVTVSVNGTSNVVVWATTGEYVTGLISASGNITGGNVLTGGLVSVAGTITGSSLLGQVVSASGNVTGGNVLTGGLISATANVTGGNLTTGGQTSAVGNITGGNLISNGIISATNNIVAGAGATIMGAQGISTSGNITANGLISASGAITSAANVTGGNLVTGGSISSFGNITGGNLVTSGTLSTSGNATFGTSLVIDSSNNSITTNNGSTINFGQRTNFNSANGVYISGNTNAQANLLVSGLTSVAGNVTGGNLLTGGLISATGTITGSSLLGAVVSASGNVTGGNVLTGGQVSATGNITTAGYFIGNFAGNITGNITAPGANTQVLYNNNGNAGASAGFTFNSTSNLLTVSGNTSSGNLLTAGQVSATGNVTGNYILGNGALLTGVITSVANINNGTSNITVVSSGGNISVGVAGTGNVAVFASTGEYVTGLISASGNITGGNILTAGIISSTGNAQHAGILTNNYYYANGTPVAFGVQYYAQTTPPSGPSAGWQWYNTSTDVLYEYLNDGTTSYWVDVSSPAFSNGPAGNLAINGNLIAGANAVYNIGSAVQTFNNVYAQNYYGNGASLSGIITSVSNINNGTSNMTVVSSGGNITTNIGGTANVGVWYNGGLTINGDLTVSGNATLTGNILGDRIVNGTTELDIQVAGGNANLTIGGTSNVVVWSTAGEYVTGLISASGNVTGGNILTGGLISATGNINGGNLTVTGDATAQNFNTLSDITLKTNINPLIDPQAVINQLFGVEYDWKDGNGHSYGLLAQEVEKVLPIAVKTNDSGLKSVNYIMLIPFLIETIKKLGSEVADLKKKRNP